MTNKMKNNTFYNVTSLAVKSYNRYFADCDKPIAVGERFFHAASLLAAGDYLGLQVSAEAENGCSAIAFSCSDLSITLDDYRWIFHDCADVDAVPENVPDDMFGENFKVYELISQASSEQDSGAKSKNHTSEYFSQLLEMMLEPGAAIRILVEPVCGSPIGRGRILFRLPHILPLRLRTTLAMAFPGTEAKEVSTVTESDAPLDCDILMHGISALLYALMCKQVKKEDTEFDDEIADLDPELSKDEFDYEPSTPIEKLDLGVRSYNCLKRKGILSVEKLRTLNDDELMHIRNLSKSCIDEIKQKLAETADTAKPVPLETTSYMEMLDSLIGLGEVKAQINRLAAFAKMKRAMAECGKAAVPIVMNMEFVGNPGTAKSTVARILSGILHEIGLLSESELVEVGRADLIAKYVGQTAEKVKEAFCRAKGKVLFIDEAYSLLDDRENSYGDEAINTIVQEMENHSEDTVVIFAGYPDKMDAFFARNPGLRSRVPFTVKFSDYSAEEMAQIVEAEAKKRGFSIAPEARQSVLNICAKATSDPKAGNGRFCRNLAESAVLSYAERIFGQTENPTEMNFALNNADFSLPATLHKVKQTGTIGFCA